MEVPRLGVESELHLPAYTNAAEMEVPRLGVESELHLPPTPLPQKRGIWAMSVTYTKAQGNTRSLIH